MSVCSIEFLLLLMVASAVFFWLPGVRSRQVLLAACNAAFVYRLVPDVAAWMVLWLVLGSGYAIIKVLLAYPRRWIFAAYLGLLLAAFLLLKQYEFLRVLLPVSLFERTVTVVGLSYVLFRQIHVLVDALQGQIERFSVWTYLNYQLNLFGLLAGPIQRYQQFQQCWDCLEPILADGYEVCRAYLRVFLGVAKIVVAATACLAIYNAQRWKLWPPEEPW
jgi:D-alanyl-lipoteichoic acid acyltransferase DltB (MBOAT superfamily)